MKSCSFKRERDINGSGTCPKTLLKSKGMDYNSISFGLFADVQSPICVRACVRARVTKWACTCWRLRNGCTCMVSVGQRGEPSLLPGFGSIRSRVCVFDLQAREEVRQGRQRFGKVFAVEQVQRLELGQLCNGLRKLFEFLAVK